MGKYRPRQTPRERIRFSMHPVDEEQQLFSRYITARPRAHQSQERWREEKNPPLCDNNTSPHRFDDDGYNPTARFRASRFDQWTNGEVHKDHRRPKRSRYPSRKNKSTMGQQYRRLQDPPVFGAHRGDSRKRRQKEMYTEYFPETREFVNTHYRKQTQNGWAIDSTHRTLPVQEFDTYLTRDEVRYDFPYRQSKRTDKQNKQRTRVRYTEQSGKTKSNYIPATPKLRMTIKMMYDLIRFIHHLDNVSTKIVNNTPLTFKRLTELLINTIKPAMPDDEVLQLLEGNARNWAYTTQIVLEQHYEDLVEGVMKRLKEDTDKSDWAQAFSTATNWAKKNFGKRMKSDVLERAEAFLTAEAGDECERGEREREAQTVAQNDPQTVPRAQDVDMDTLRAVKPKKGTQYVHAQIQTSPRDRAEPNERPKTPPNRGDWSFDDEFPPLVPPPTIQPTPVRPLKPLPQRVQRRILTGTLVDIDVPRTDRVEPQPVEQGSISTVRGESLEQWLGQKETEYTHNKDKIEEHTHTSGPMAISTLPSHSRMAGSPARSTVDSEEYQFSVYSTSTIVGESPTAEKAPGQTTKKSQTENTETKERERVLQVPHTSQNENATVAPMTPSTPKSVGRPYRHIRTDRKQTDWSLNLKRKFVIIGDSNVSRIPAFSIPDLQIDSFPGAKFQHAGNLIEKATIALEPEVLVLSFGINNRSQRCLTSTNREIQRAYRMARTRLPHTEVVMPLVNFADGLPIEEQRYLEAINRFISGNLNFVEALPSTQFQVESDLIHWTSATARAMLDHWVYCLNF